jgi:hypothetical protein
LSSEKKTLSFFWIFFPARKAQDVRRDEETIPLGSSPAYFAGTKNISRHE